MSSGCCGASGMRRLRIAGQDVGVAGLDAILERLYLEGWAPGESGIEPVMLDLLRHAGNYVPPALESAYTMALQGLFREFYEANVPGGSRQK